MPESLETLAPRTAQVGLGAVDRYLPGRQRHLIGAWCFLDLFGAHPGPDSGVGPHPHIGIQTATWLLSGVSVHRDSLGNTATSRPGALSLMTAGRGITHAEEPPPDSSPPPRGAQLWIALPESSRITAPGFARDEAATGSDSGAQLSVFFGSLAGASALGRFYSPIVGAEIRLPSGSLLELALEEDFEHGLLALDGDLSIGGEAVEGGVFSYLAPGTRRLRIASERGAAILLIGGTPFEEPILMWWNFVARSEEEIAAARNDWEGGLRFGDVHGSALARIPAPALPALHLHARPRVS